MADNNFDGHLLIEGVKGECKIKGYHDWIDIDEFAYGAECSFEPATKDGKGTLKGQDGRPKAITFTGPMHRGSIALMGKCLSGATIEEVKFHVRKAGGSESLVYLELTLKGCVITQIDVDAKGHYPTETLTVEYTTIDLKYREQHSATGGMYKEYTGGFARTVQGAAGGEEE